MGFFSYQRILRDVLSWRQALVFSVVLCTLCAMLLPVLSQVYSLNLHTKIGIFVCVPLVVAALVDSVCHILPDPLLLCAAVLGVFSLLFSPWNDIGQALITASVFLALGLLLSSLTSLGRGDAKLMGVLGLWLASPLAVCIALLLAFTGAALFALVLLVIGRATMSSSIALGPWIVAGGFLSFLLSCISAG